MKQRLRWWWAAAPADELIDTIHSHPTVTETVREAALNVEMRAIHTIDK